MFTDPVKNLQAFGLKENDIVADLGAGTGYYAVAAGKMVGLGKVYAVEIINDFLGTIKNKVKEAHLSNVEIIWGDLEQFHGTKLGDGVADAVIASNILFQIANKENFVAETKRILKPKGRVLLVDWAQSEIMGGGKIVPKEKALEMFQKEGFILQREINAGSYHYGMILIKS